MANITSAASGNFSNPATWAGGVVPGPNDRAISGTTHVINIDTNVTCIAIESTNSGYFVLPDGVTLTANVEGGSTAANNYVLQYSGVTGASIVGNVTNTGTVTSAGVVRHNGTGILTITGNLSFGASGADRCCVALTANGADLIVNGNVSATTVSGTGSHAVQFNAPGASTGSTGCSVTVNGTVTGGTSGTSSSGVFANSNSGGNVIAVNGNVVAGTVSNGHGISSAGTGNTITVTGNVSGGSGSRGISSGAPSAAITVNGDVLGGLTDAAIWLFQTGTVTVNGNVYAGNNSNSSASLNDGIALTNNVVAVLAVNGNVYGADNNPNSGATAGVGIRSEFQNSRITVNGTLFGGARSSAVAGTGILILGATSTAVDHPVGVNAIAFAGRVRLTAGSQHVHQRRSFEGYDVFGELSAGAEVSLVSADSTSMLDEQDVRVGVVYANGTLTGTLAVPPAASVSAGVPVDDTVGTGTVVLANVAAVVGAQIAAAMNGPA